MSAATTTVPANSAAETALSIETASPADRFEAAGLRGDLRSRSFLGLLATQFLGATNDNMFRWLVVPIAKEIVGRDEALREGDLVGIFPEGNITRSGKMEEFQPGFLSMRKGTGTPVVPVYLGRLWGSIFSFERGRFFWKWPKRWPYPVTIRIGRPIAEPADGEQIRQSVMNLE